MNLEEDKLRAKAFIKKKMKENGIYLIKDLVIGLGYQSLRQAISINRFPLRVADKLAKTLNTTKDELESNGLHFFEIKERRKISIAGRRLDTYRHHNILPFLKVICACGAKSCTVDELARLLEIQGTLSKPMNCRLVSQLIANFRK